MHTRTRGRIGSGPDIVFPKALRRERSVFENAKLQGVRPFNARTTGASALQHPDTAFRLPWVNCAWSAEAASPSESAMAPIGDVPLQRNDTTRWAITGREQTATNPSITASVITGSDPPLLWVKYITIHRIEARYCFRIEQGDNPGVGRIPCVRLADESLQAVSIKAGLILTKKFGFFAGTYNSAEMRLEYDHLERPFRRHVTTAFGSGIGRCCCAAFDHDIGTGAGHRCSLHGPHWNRTLSQWAQRPSCSDRARPQ